MVVTPSFRLPVHPSCCAELPAHMRCMRRNRRMSSLPANRARATNAAAPSASHVMGFIVGPLFLRSANPSAPIPATYRLISGYAYHLYHFFFRRPHPGPKVGPGWGPESVIVVTSSETCRTPKG